MAASSKNQYVGKLKLWEKRKYHPRRNRVFDQPKKRKRRQDDKDSDLHICEYTREETEFEFARPVHPGHEWCGFEEEISSYTTICTPQSEHTHLSSMYRAFLLRNLPWYIFIHEIQNLGRCLIAILDVVSYTLYLPILTMCDSVLVWFTMSFLPPFLNWQSWKKLISCFRPRRYSDAYRPTNLWYLRGYCHEGPCQSVR